MTSIRRKSSPFVLITDINPALQKYKLKAHILRLWKTFKKSTINSIQLVLVDEVGTRIHGSVDDGLVKKFISELKEGETVVLDTFDLVSYSAECKISDIPFKLNFLRTTAVKKCIDYPADVPQKYLKSFDQVLGRALDKRIMIDVIGQIVGVGCLKVVNTKGKSTSKLEIELRNTSGGQLTCTLWGDYAKDVFKYSEHHPKTVIVCVLRLVCIKEYQGTVTISNTYNATKIFYNPKDPVVENFLKALPADGIVVTSYNDTIQVPPNTDTIRDEFLVKNPRRTINDIVYSDETGRCVVMVTIETVETSKLWYYISCKACNKKVAPYPERFDYDGPPLYYCEKVCMKDVTDVVARYRLVLRVSDNSGGQAAFLCFDSVAEILIGMSAATLSYAVAEDDPAVLPQPITELFGKTYLFKINVTDDNIKNSRAPYAVDLTTNDQNLISEFQSLTTIEETQEEIPASSKDSETSSELVISSNSKRISPERDDIEDTKDYSLCKKQKPNIE